jgi:hypothetical protein
MTKSKIGRHARSKIARLIRARAVAPAYGGAALLASAALMLSITSAAAATEKPGAAPAGPPTVSTGAVTHPHGSSAELDGIVDPRGAATTYYFQYGLSSAYGHVTGTGNLPTGTSKVKIALPVNGFLIGDHYRLVATNAFGTKTGRDAVYTNKKKSKFELPKSPEAVLYGAPCIISGTLGGAQKANRQLVLQGSPYPYTAAFAPVGAPVVTDALGHFTFRIPSLTASTEFRVSTLGGPRPIVGKVFTEHVAVRVTLKVRSRGPKGLVRVYGTITPAEVGARVFIQLRKPVKGTGGKAERTTRFSTEFTTTSKRATRTISRFSAVLTVQHAGRYRAYVEIKKGPLVSGASVSAVLSAVPGAGKAHKKAKKKRK